MIVAACEQFGDKTDDEEISVSTSILKNVLGDSLELDCVRWALLKIELPHFFPFSSLSSVCHELSSLALTRYKRQTFPVFVSNHTLRPHHLIVFNILNSGPATPRWHPVGLQRYGDGKACRLKFSRFNNCCRTICTHLTKRPCGRQLRDGAV